MYLDVDDQNGYSCPIWRSPLKCSLLCNNEDSSFFVTSPIWTVVVTNAFLSVSCRFISVLSGHFPLQTLPGWHHKAGMESRGNPLKESRGERWFHSDWDAKSVRIESWRLTSEVVSLAVLWVDSRDLPRQFGRDLTCKENDVCDILPVDYWIKMAGPSFRRCIEITQNATRTAKE